MKFNLTFDFDELEFDEGNITDQLKQSIIRDLIYNLRKEIDEKVMNAISASVRTTIEAQMNDIIAQKIKEIVESGTIKKQYGSDATTVEGYIKDVFTNKNLSSSLNNEIERNCKSFVDAMKKQYDLNFASHIVKNMQANNLLNDDVAKLLISKN